jgi:hypothetical protein
MKYIVTAMSVSPMTGEITGEPREEVIDTETNEIFAGATGRWDVEDRYLAFWNRLSDSWEEEYPPDQKVIVLTVKEA